MSSVVVVDKKSKEPTDYIKTSTIVKSQIIEDTGLLVIEHEDTAVYGKVHNS